MKVVAQSMYNLGMVNDGKVRLQDCCALVLMNDNTLMDQETCITKMLPIIV